MMSQPPKTSGILQNSNGSRSLEDVTHPKTFQHDVSALLDIPDEATEDIPDSSFQNLKGSIKKMVKILNSAEDVKKETMDSGFAWTSETLRRHHENSEDQKTKMEQEESKNQLKEELQNEKERGKLLQFQIANSDARMHFLSNENARLVWNNQLLQDGLINTQQENTYLRTHIDNDAIVKKLEMEKMTRTIEDYRKKESAARDTVESRTIIEKQTQIINDLKKQADRRADRTFRRFFNVGTKTGKRAKQSKKIRSQNSYLRRRIASFKRQGERREKRFSRCLFDIEMKIEEKDENLEKKDKNLLEKDEIIAKKTEENQFLRSQLTALQERNRRDLQTPLQSSGVYKTNPRGIDSSRISMPRIGVFQRLEKENPAKYAGAEPRHRPGQPKIHHQNIQSRIRRVEYKNNLRVTEERRREGGFRRNGGSAGAVTSQGPRRHLKRQHGNQCGGSDAYWKKPRF